MMLLAPKRMAVVAGARGSLAGRTWVRWHAEVASLPVIRVGIIALRRDGVARILYVYRSRT